MKKIILGIIIGLIIFPAAYEIAEWKIKKLPYRAEYGITKPFKKNCTKDVWKNGHGWVFVGRDYFSCGFVSIFVSDLIYGEYTKPRDPELEKKACKGCKL